MPSFAMTVPYIRTSPIHIPRRDLVLAAADSLSLRVTVVDSDRACSQAIELTGGIGGPGAQFSVWADTHEPHCWDYGANRPACGQILWTGAGVLSDAPGVIPWNALIEDPNANFGPGGDGCSAGSPIPTSAS
jgi:hypothetical protein